MPSERVQRRIDSLLDEAERAMSDGAWDKVRVLCDSVLRLDHENSDAKAYLEAARHDSAVRGGGAAPDITPSPSIFIADKDPSCGQPSSFAGGRYAVKRFLGEGGKKKVYLAHDTTLDRDVAFALIKTEGLDDTGRERVRREAQAMGRMGTHPCIMPIYDMGEEPVAGGTGTQPYMVQPLMGGGDVEGLIEDAGGPLELEAAISIADQTAKGLVFAHSKGIVHRDLKPGNVWLDEDGAAKIGDFGLAVATDRSRLTVEKVMVGTVNYMPPEQATGGELTPRADLYSLGAMLYEMCTGRVPFMGDDEIAVISQHVNTPPVAPSWHNPKIPRALDSLILRLMAKDPAERPESADEVLKALKAVDLSAVSGDESEKGAGSLESMAGGVFVGRQREMDQLKATFEEVLSGRGRMVTLVGEPGIGKTRTAQELATYAGMRGGQVLWGRSYEGGGAPPYWPWVQAIRSYVQASEPESLRSRMGSAAPVIAEVVPDVKEKLPGLPAPTPIEDPESARFRLFDSVSTFLKSASRSQPLVLMLEDLHWADRPSLMLLEFAARELANTRILIVGNYRDVELNRRHPLAVTLGDLTRERLFERILLRGLQRHDVARFIEIAAGIDPPSALVDTVHSQTEGNPLFVTETVRLLIQEGDIASGRAREGGTTSWEIRIPEGVREVIGRRLDRLSERCNEVLTIAAVIGRQFRFGVLKLLVEDTTEGQLLDAMDEALSARIIEELPSEIGLYQFTHAQMQETLTLELSANRRVRMHARIAEALEDYYGNRAEEHASELAEHFAEAETVLGMEKLVKYSLAAGERAQEAHSTETALRYFERCNLALTEDAPAQVRARVLEGLGRSQGAVLGISHSQQVSETLARSFALYLQSGDTDGAVRVATIPLGLAVLIRGAADVLEKAITLVRPGSRDHGRLLAKASRHYRIERSEQAGLAAADEAIAIGRGIGDNTLLAEAYYGRSVLRAFSGTVPEYEACLVDAAAAFEAASQQDDTYFRIRSSIARAIPLLGLGRAAEAAESGHLGARLARNIGEKTWGYLATRWAYFAELCTGNLSIPYETTPNNINAESVYSPVLFAQRVRAESGASVDVPAVTEAISGIDRRERPPADRLGRGGEAAWGLISAAHIVRMIDSGLEGPLRQAIERDLARLEAQPAEYAVIGYNLARGLLAVHEGDYGSAPALLSALEPHRGTNWQTSMVDPVLGGLCRLAGKDDLAAIHFENGIDVARAGGHKLGLAWSLFDYSDLLLDRNAPGDREKAIELQDETIAIARELGMKPLLELVLAKREILKA